MDLYLQNDKQLRLFLQRFINEAYGEASGAEKNAQKKMQNDLKGLRASDDASDVDEQDEDAPSEEQPSDQPARANVKKPSDEKVAQASMQDIIKTLNVMRSGRSTKDPEVRKALKSYIDGLTSGEQQSLYAFLSGLAEMMVAGETGKEATDPGEVGIDIDPATVKKTGEKITVKKTVQKGTSDAPIVVGEHSDKSHELRRLRELAVK